MHKSVLPVSANFFALQVHSDDLYDRVAVKGDVLVFAEQDHAEEGDLVVIEPETDTFYFGEVGYQKDKTLLRYAAQNKEPQLFNNVLIRGKAVSLVRDMT